MTESSENEPILPTPARAQQQNKKKRSAWRFPRSYGGFEYQKRVWESTARRSSRIRVVAWLQLVLGVLSSWNYLWLTNIFGVFVGAVGLKAVRSDKMSWTIVYLLVCAMEVARNVMLAPHIYDRYSLPHIVFTHYEYFQVGVMALQVGFLIPQASNCFSPLPYQYVPKRKRNQRIACNFYATTTDGLDRSDHGGRCRHPGLDARIPERVWAPTIASANRSIRRMSARVQHRSLSSNISQ